MNDAPKKSSKRGGARPGAGRKPQPRSDPPPLPTIAIDPAELARERARSALSALMEVVFKGKSDVARVRAANIVLDRAIGKPSSDGGHLFKIVEYSVSETDGDAVTFRSEARKHIDAIFIVLTWISQNSKNESARIAASSSLIERAHGTTQPPQIEPQTQPPAPDRATDIVHSWETLLHGAKAH